MPGLTDSEVARLTPPERLALISQLWDSLEADQLPLLSRSRTNSTSGLRRLMKTVAGGVDLPALKAELDER